MKLPFNHILSGTASTKRPLLIILTHDASCKQPLCMVGDEMVPEEQLHEVIMAQNEHFSTEPVILRVRWDQLQNLMLIDTPGMLLEATDTLKEAELRVIEKIIAQQINQRNTRLIVVLDGLRDYGTDPIVKYLNDVKPGWSDGAIVLVNKCDLNQVRALSILSVEKGTKIVAFLTTVSTHHATGISDGSRVDEASAELPEEHARQRGILHVLGEAEQSGKLCPAYGAHRQQPVV